MGAAGVQVLRCTGPETCMSAPAGEIANELVLLEYNEESREKGSKGVRSQVSPSCETEVFTEKQNFKEDDETYRVLVFVLWVLFVCLVACPLLFKTF